MISNVLVIFGGKSCEHDISIISALQVIQGLQRKYHVYPLYISKEGVFYSTAKMSEVSYFSNLSNIEKMKYRVSLVRGKKEAYLKKKWKKIRIDFAIPVMHGKNGEDGSIQGFLNILNIPYAGNNLLTSAIAQSKIESKILMNYYQIPTLDYTYISDNYKNSSFFPCIIKPNTLGSSIGIQIVKDKTKWQEKVEEALLYDELCLVEPFIEEFREINCSVMKRDTIICVSELEEVQKSDDILSFEDKYKSLKSKSVTSKRIVKPLIDENIKNEIYDIAKKMYDSFRFTGVIRIDFMIIKDKVYVNEVNSIPGSYAFYLWKNKDMETLLNEVIKESLFYYHKNECKIHMFSSNVLENYKSGRIKK